MSAFEEIIEKEARALFLSSSLLGENLDDKKEILQIIVNKALIHLYDEELKKLKGD